MCKRATYPKKCFWLHSSSSMASNHLIIIKVCLVNKLGIIKREKKLLPSKKIFGSLNLYHKIKLKNTYKMTVFLRASTRLLTSLYIPSKSRKQTKIYSCCSVKVIPLHLEQNKKTRTCLFLMPLNYLAFELSLNQYLYSLVTN